MDVEREQDNIIKLVSEYPQSNVWMEPLSKYGPILDNFAKICYKRHLPIIFEDKEVEDLKVVLKDREDIYCHLVLAHSFTEFMLLTGLKAFDILPVDEKIEKPKFLRFCKINDVPEHLIEPGWKEYLES